MDRVKFVFVNYRGDDSRGYPALLYTELARRFGPQHAFLDRQSIPAGADYEQELLDRVRSAAVILAVIGPDWLAASGQSGRRALDDPADWVRRELAEAFAAGVRVIPVLTDDTECPAQDDLPTEIAALSKCQFRRLRRFEPIQDLNRIIRDLAKLVPELAAAARQRDGVPRQLPAAPHLFTGRATELAALTDAGASTGATVVISAIGGAGGIGKTTLALQWAYENLNRFPDGQLYVDLRGFDPIERPISAGEAILTLLDGLGVEAAALPVTLDAQAARYRTLVAGKQMLVMLDNAHDVDQVIPLLPSSATCTVLITSRRHLAGLVRHGGHLIDLDVLAEPDARDLLARHVGVERLAAESDAVAELLAVCAGLPLAVAIVAVLAQRHPSFGLAVLAEELRDDATRLDGMDAGDAQVNLRAVLSSSVRALSPAAARLFGLLGIAPGPNISLPAAACLAALSVTETRTVLQTLEDASLVRQYVPGRYQMHDLIRLSAIDSAGRELTDNVPEAALRRVLDFYINTAGSADRLLSSRRLADDLNPAVSGLPDQPSTPPGYRLTSRVAALDWMRVERDALDACMEHLAQRSRTADFLRLVASLTTFWFLDSPGNAAVVRKLHHAVEAWRGLGDQVEEATAQINLGRIQQIVGDYVAAAQAYQRAYELFEAVDDQAGRAATLNRQGALLQVTDNVWGSISLYEQALDLSRAAGDRYVEADALSRLGQVHQVMWDHSRALPYLEQALTLYRELGDDQGKADVLLTLGRIKQTMDERRAAVELYAECLQLHLTLGSRLGQATVLLTLSRVDARPADRLEEAITLFRELGSQQGLGNALNSLASMRSEAGQYDEAERLLDEALTVWDKLGHRQGKANTLITLGQLRLLTGDLREADRLLTEAKSLFDDLSDRIGQANVHEIRGDLRLVTAGRVSAESCYRKSVELWCELGQDTEQARLLHKIGTVLANSVGPMAAELAYREALPLAARDPELEADIQRAISECTNNTGR